jgi:hypothetical protein
VKRQLVFQIAVELAAVEQRTQTEPRAGQDFA